MPWTCFGQYVKSQRKRYELHLCRIVCFHFVFRCNRELYIKEKMTKRLAIPQLAAFTKGFNRLASMTPLMKTIFKAEDLRDVILGEELDWNAFRLVRLCNGCFQSDGWVLVKMKSYLFGFSLLLWHFERMLFKCPYIDDGNLPSPCYL